MNDYGTQNSHGDLSLTKAGKGNWWEERTILGGLQRGHWIWSELCKKHIMHADRKSPPE
jgi:hypothetical protein